MEAALIRCGREFNAIFLSNLFQIAADKFFQLRRCIDPVAAKVEMDDRVLRPLVVALIDPQIAKEFLFALKNFMKNREQQTLAKAARAREKVKPLRVLHKIIDPARLVDV